MNRLIDFKSRFRILKGGKISLVVSALLGSAVIASAAPSGGSVTSGTASISQSGTVTNIEQSTQKATINWNDFSIKANETVNFNQPNSSSITLNRVVGNEKSVISGALNANGQVWILNSNGVLFNSTASINTSGILATTAELSDTDFNAGNYNFKNSSKNSVINLGTIEVANSGYLVLASNEVKNAGTIKAVKGKVHLVGANEYTLNLNGNSIVNLIVNKGVLDSMVENSGTIISDGGEVYLTTNAVNELLKGVVNNTGIIEANSLDGLMGKVEVFAHGGTAEVGGTITALDGFVETSGKTVDIKPTVKVKAKEWLIDPTNITITDATAYETSLNGGTNVTIETVSTGTEDGDIYVNDEITWNAASKLTLKAHNDIFINKSITATNTAGQLALYYGQVSSDGGTSDYYINAKVNLKAGNNFITKLGNNTGVDETTWTVVDASNMNTDMNLDKTKHYALGTDIVLSGINNWTPIGNDSTKFTGKFDGLGHTIDKLTIDSSNTYLGLFGYTEGATIKNVGVTNVNITGSGSSSYVGGLVGYSTIGSKIINSYASGTVSGNYYVGGLVGLNYSSSTINNSYASGIVAGSGWVGGLVGWNYNSSTITNSYASGTVSGSTNVGGLVGSNNNSTIANSYATGTVTGSGSSVGGLVGTNIINPTITNSYYDNEANRGTMQDKNTYGKTKAEIKTAFSDLTGWATGGASIEGFSTDIFILPQLKSLYTPTSTLFEGGYGTSTDAYTITNWTQLQNINYANDTTLLSKYYTLSNDLGTTTSDYTNLASTTSNSGAGWNPIGNDSTQFIGNFDGLGHTIDNLTINSSGVHNIGLFGFTNGATIKNVGVTNVDITGGGGNVGGLVGSNNNSTITNSYVTGSVTGSESVGGLVGFNSSNSTITNSYASGTVSGSGSHVGGLVGYNYNSTITNSYASGTVTGSGTGGLVGYRDNSTVTNSFWDKESSGQTVGVGGTGASQAGVTSLTTKQMSYGQVFKDASWDIVADSSVTSSTPVIKYDSINDKYYWAIAPLSLAYNLGTKTSTYDGTTQNLSNFYTTNSIFDSQYGVSDTDYKFQKDSLDVTGYKNAATYENIKVASTNDFLAIKTSGNTDGIFQINSKAITVKANDLTKVYGSAEKALTYTASGLLGTDTLTLKRVAGEDVNTYAISQDTTLANSNYTVTFTNGTYTITPKAITVKANDLTKVYGSAEKALTYTASGLVGSDTLTGTLKRATGESVGDYTISQNATLVNSNYTITFVDGKYIITAKPTNKVNNIITAIANTNVLKVEIPKVFKTPIVGQKVAENNQTTNGPQNQEDVTIPLSGDSLVSLINGGVNLPDGVDQLFFSASNKNQEN